MSPILSWFKKSSADKQEQSRLSFPFSFLQYRIVITAWLVIILHFRINTTNERHTVGPDTNVLTGGSGYTHLYFICTYTSKGRVLMTSTKLITPRSSFMNVLLLRFHRNYFHSNMNSTCRFCN